MAGGYGAGDPPDPIPNSEVKTRCADGTAGATRWESTAPPAFFFTPNARFELHRSERAFGVSAGFRNYRTHAENAESEARRRGRGSRFSLSFLFLFLLCVLRVLRVRQVVSRSDGSGGSEGTMRTCAAASVSAPQRNPHPCSCARSPPRPPSCCC